MKPLLVPDDLDSDEHTELVVDASDYLSKATLSKNVNDLVSVGEVVSWDDSVVSALVIVAKIWCVRLHVAHDLVGVLRAAKVDVVEVDNLSPLVDVEHGDADGLVCADALLGRRALSQGIQCTGGDLSLFASRAHLSHLLLCHHVVLVQIRGGIQCAAHSGH